MSSERCIRFLTKRLKQIKTHLKTRVCVYTHVLLILHQKKISFTFKLSAQRRGID